jgi:hypothetical protein
MYEENVYEENVAPLSGFRRSRKCRSGGAPKQSISLPKQSLVYRAGRARGAPIVRSVSARCPSGVSVRARFLFCLTEPLEMPLIAR